MSADEPPSGPDSRVLVAYLPHPRDLDLAEQQGWYRIRSREMADRLRGGIDSFAYLAFYPGCPYSGQTRSLSFPISRSGR